MHVTDAQAIDVWGGVVGQADAVAQLRAAAADPVHAYLFVGPPGSGKRSLALAFAADLLQQGLPPEEAERAAALALAGRHPDVFLVERVGPSIDAMQARRVVELATLAPTEGDRKVLVLDEFHLVERQAPILLKIIEEPPPSTVFVVLADAIPPGFVTIASRCVQIVIGPLTTAEIAAALERDGVEPARAAEAADVAGGDLRRARVLATDPQVAARRAAWAEVPYLIDGSGSAASSAVARLMSMIEEAAAPLEVAHARELADLEERVKLTGERGSGRKDLADRHKRELRRYRTDEVRSGFAVLTREYRGVLEVVGHPGEVLDGIERIRRLARELVRNPTVELQLLDLFLHLPPLAHHGRR